MDKEPESAGEIIARLEHSIQTHQNNTHSRPSSEPPDCALCGGVGYIIGKKPLNRRARECVCVVQKRILLRIPERFREALLFDFPDSIVEFVAKWIMHPGDGLVLTGPAGTGKTHLAAGIVKALLELRHEVQFVRCSEVYQSAREIYRDNTDENELYWKYAQPEFLILDDLGAGSLSDHERRVTLELLDRRINKLNRPTCLTTNWGLAEISRKFDERIASRLQGFKILELEGADRRAATA